MDRQVCQEHRVSMVNLETQALKETEVNQDSEDLGKSTHFYQSLIDNFEFWNRIKIVFLYSFKGERGEVGLTGLTGNRGFKGFEGEIGLPGRSGVPGIRGELGSQGKRGSPGGAGIPGLKVSTTNILQSLLDPMRKKKQKTKI